MTKQTKTILIALGVVAVGYFFWQKSKKGKKATAPKGKSFDGEDDYFENFDYDGTASFAGDDDFFNAVGKRRVVGGYDAARDRTWIFTEGSRGQGQWVSGRVNAPQGTIIN